jgi:chemotaxis signal transduction protein
MFISLPALFRLQESAPNGVVLKNTSASKEASQKTILLTPKIDIDLEIPDENIHRLPESFSGQFRYFRGVCFNDQNVIFILDPEKLTGAG